MKKQSSPRWVNSGISLSGINTCNLKAETLTLATQINVQLMKNIFPILIVILLAAASSCKQKGYPKPDNLLSQKQMADILYDIHVGEAMSTRHRYANADSIKIESKEVYQGILDKYHLTDSLLTENIIFYSSRPKLYEKVYEKVVEKLNLQIEASKEKKNLEVIKKQDKDKE